MGKLTKAAVLALAVSLAPAAPVMASPLQDAAAAYKRGDYATALLLLRPLADQRDTLAEGLLGLMYKNGEGVRQDDVQAASWYRKAADQGDDLAQTSLGKMYEYGQGVPQDYVQAHKWYNLAAARFPPSEAIERKIAVSARDLIAAKMTPAQVAEAQRLAREWKPK